MELGLQGKTVFITGSSKGIGFATARAFLREGAVVVLNARDAQRLDAACTELERNYPNRVCGVCGDISSESTLERAEKLLEDRFGALDVFVANLGSGKPLAKDPLNAGELQRFYSVNVLGNMGALDRVLPLLKKGGDASVIFLSSIVAKERAAAPCGYAASKSAVLTMTKYLAGLWASAGIRVNCVLPGNVLFEGGRWEELLAEDREGVTDYINERVPMKRFGRPEEIADAILFLASKRASFITGASLVVDGGQLGAV